MTLERTIEADILFRGGWKKLANYGNGYEVWGRDEERLLLEKQGNNYKVIVDYKSK